MADSWTTVADILPSYRADEAKTRAASAFAIRRRIRIVGLLLIAEMLAFLGATQTKAHADTFGSGANTFDIEFVTIGNPGNAADTTGNPNPAGSVPYTYRMAAEKVSGAVL